MLLKKLLQTLVSIAFLIPFCVNADNMVTDVGEGVGNAAADVGNAVKSAVKKTGKTIDKVVTGDKNNTAATEPTDKTITTNVRAKIKDLKDNDKINAADNLEVSTNKGVVRISGTVRHPEDIDAVKAAARSEAGVKDVVLNVQVRAR